MSEPRTRQLLKRAAATGAGYPIDALEGDHVFTATVVGDAAVIATVVVEGSNDLVGYSTIATLTLSGTGTASGSASTSKSYRYWRANVTAVSGGSVSVTSATEEGGAGMGGLADGEFYLKVSTSSSGGIVYSASENGLNLLAFARDGQLDWTDALTRALAASADEKRPVFVPAGVSQYDVSGSIIMPSGAQLVGQSWFSRIKSNLTAGPVIDASMVDDVLIYGLSFEGTRTDDATLGDGVCIQISGGNRIRIERNKIRLFTGAGVLMQGYDYRIPSAAATLAQGVWDSWVIGNYVEGCSQGAMIYNDPRNVIVAHNRVHRSANVGIMTDDSHVLPGGTETSRPAIGISIVNNVVTESRSSGIALAGTSDSLVSGNRVFRSGQTGTDPTSLIATGIVMQVAQHPQPCVNNRIAGNAIAYCSGSAMSIQGAANNEIVDNRIYNNAYNRTGSAGSNGIVLQLATAVSTFGASGNIIEGNRCIVNDALSKIGSHIQIVDSSCTDNEIRRNRFFGGQGTNKIADAGLRTILDDNDGWNGQGTVSGTGVTVIEQGDDAIHRTVINIGGTAVGLFDRGASGDGKQLLYTFPPAAIKILAITLNVSHAVPTLADGDVVQVGLGSAPAVSGDTSLAGTKSDYLATTMTVATGAASASAIADTLPLMDGRTTAKLLYINYAMATDPVGNENMVLTGSVTIHWCKAS